MLDPAAQIEATEPTDVVADVTCLACGCLCDDLVVAVRDARVVGVSPDCAVGRAWFLAPHPAEIGPAARLHGAPADLDAALDQAAALLRKSRAPLVWGLTHLSVEAVGLALELADRVGATVDPAGSAGRAGLRAAFVRSGLISATLGEVRDRAETILFWGNHPDSTHPRHADRYSARARGRFAAKGRTVLVVDVGPDHAGAGSADLRLTLDAAKQEVALGVLLALVRGVTLDPGRVTQATGLDLAIWTDLAGRLVAARWVAIFFGPAATQLGPTGFDRLVALVAALHRDGRRAVGLALGEPGNGPGAEATLTWQGGAPSALDFGPGWPDHQPNEATLADRLARGTVDAILALGPDPRSILPADEYAQLDARLTIRIGPDATRADPSGRWPAVAIATGRLGIETGGTVARVDGLMLPLRPPLATSAWPNERSILQSLLDRLIARSSGV